MAGKARITRVRRATQWEVSLTTTMQVECTKELCIVLSAQRFLGTAPEGASKVLYECNSAHMLLEQVRIEEELEAMLAQGAQAVEEGGIQLGRDIQEDVDALRQRRDEQAAWAQALESSFRAQLASGANPQGQ